VAFAERVAKLTGPQAAEDRRLSARRLSDHDGRAEHRTMTYTDEETAMPEITSPRIGHFCWFELATNDQQAAKQFYSGLFGWTFVEFPMGPDSVYTMFQLGGRDVGACYTMQPDQRARGIPPHWMTYIAVANADEAAAKAASLGAQVLAPAFDVFDVGRMAVLQDPTGATFCIWQAKRHIGARVMGEPNTFCWSELMARDTPVALKFYTTMFGWGTHVTTNQAGFAYTHWTAGNAPIGGMMEISPEMGAIPAHWMNYIATPDCDAIARKAIQLGGKAVQPPFDIPGTGRMAVLQDPQGAMFSIIHITNPKP
jgi:predicted enzyme related to lactoylglutathione lyase